jgi:anti-anti-sigma regulatory factor
MIKIQAAQFDDRVVLEVCGRIAGAFVPELQRAWRSALAERPGCQVLIDLQQVTCVDRAGRALLQSMHRSGAGFLRAGIATQDILEQIMEQDCGQQSY